MAEQSPTTQLSGELKRSDESALSPELVRGIPLTTLMSCACAVLGRGDDEAQQWYERSKPVDSFSYFLGHSWKDGRFSKALALTLHISRRSAIWVSCSIVFVVACLQYFDVVPLPSYTFTLMDGRPSTNGISCLIIGCIAWFLYLVLAPLLRPSEMWFVDKACIHQEDGELKRKGIRAMREFLERSKTMVILLTPNYFARGSCTFEVATFLASQGIHFVQIVPLSRSALVMCAFGISVFAATVFHLSIYVGVPDDAALIPGQPKIFGVKAEELLAFCAPPGLVFGIAYFIVLHYVAQKEIINDEIKSFSLEKAEFEDDSDRLYVTKGIETLFGTVGNFETRVHTEVYEKVEGQLGSDRWQTIPYDAVVLGALPCLWWCVDMFCTDPPGIKYIDFFMGTTLAFMFLPLFFAMLGVWAKFELLLTKDVSMCAQLVVSAVASVFACIIGVIGMTLTLGVYIYKPWQSALILWLAYIVATVATFAECPGTRRSQSQQEEAEAPMLPP